MHAIFNEKLKQITFEQSPNWDGDWHSKYGGTWNDVFAHSIDGFSAGIPFSAELANINGISVILFCGNDITEEHIQRAKSALKRNRDVVGFFVYRGKYMTPLPEKTSSMDWYN